jgi:hypothetical protein
VRGGGGREEGERGREGQKEVQMGTIEGQKLRKECGGRGCQSVGGNGVSVGCSWEAEGEGVSQ